MCACGTMRWVQGPGSGGHLARIEVGAAEIPRLLADGLHTIVADKLRALGYAHVTLDLAGYRRGSTNGVSSVPIAFRA